SHVAPADLRLLRLTARLPAAFGPAPLAMGRKSVAVGDHFLVAGYGVAIRGDGRSGGTIRTADLVATGQPGTLQVRLVDAVTNGVRAGLSACTGDSGAPVFDTSEGRLRIVGIVSWSTGPALSDGCGGLTRVTPLLPYHARV